MFLKSHKLKKRHQNCLARGTAQWQSAYLAPRGKEVGSPTPRGRQLTVYTTRKSVLKYKIRMPHSWLFSYKISEQILEILSRGATSKEGREGTPTKGTVHTISPRMCFLLPDKETQPVSNRPPEEQGSDPKPSPNKPLTAGCQDTNEISPKNGLSKQIAPQEEARTK